MIFRDSIPVAATASDVSEALFIDLVDLPPVEARAELEGFVLRMMLLFGDFSGK
jgi:hypothetical protein